MIKNSKKITLVTNIILIVVFSFVVAVGFIPNNVISIYGGAPIKAIYNGNVLIKIYINKNQYYKENRRNDGW